jgi:hypothetical protein
MRSTVTSLPRRHVKRAVLAPLSAALLLAALLLLWAQDGAARGTIKLPNEHPHYTLELEPHLALGLFNPPGIGTGNGFGPGLRLSFPVTEAGFIPSINDTVAVGVGLDWVFYDAENAVRARCTEFVPGPNDTEVCVEVGGESGDSQYFYVPVVMQWNFWFHKQASAFFEPGLAVYLREDTGRSDIDPGLSMVLQFGGRWHFADTMALTLRLGYPLSSLGVSFLF